MRWRPGPGKPAREPVIWSWARICPQRVVPALLLCPVPQRAPRSPLPGGLPRCSPLVTRGREYHAAQQVGALVSASWNSYEAFSFGVAAMGHRRMTRLHRPAVHMLAGPDPGLLATLARPLTAFAARSAGCWSGWPGLRDPLRYVRTGRTRSPWPWMTSRDGARCSPRRCGRPAARCQTTSAPTAPSRGLMMRAAAARTG